MITTIPDRERALQARVDALTAELARLRAAIQTAYGYLWCVNNEPGTPIDLYPPEKAAYEARKVLRDLLTTEQRGQGINSVLPTVRSAPPAQPAEPTIDEQVASVNAVFDAWRNGEDATLTLAAQPAEPVQRLSDEQFDNLVGRIAQIKATMTIDGVRTLGMFGAEEAINIVLDAIEAAPKATK